MSNFCACISNANAIANKQIIVISRNKPVLASYMSRVSAGWIYRSLYRGADKSLAPPTSRCILFDGEDISFDANLVIYVNSSNIPPIMIINRIYETQNLLSL